MTTRRTLSSSRVLSFDVLYWLYFWTRSRLERRDKEGDADGPDLTLVFVKRFSQVLREVVQLSTQKDPPPWLEMDDTL